MRRRLSRLLLALLVGIAPLAGSGCFVLEELEAGQEIMDRHFSGSEGEEGREERAVAATPPEDEPPRRRNLWEGGRTLNPKEMSSEIARCELGGRVQYMARRDCRARGGSPR